MDPFIKIDFDGNTFKTDAKLEGGHRPIWNHTIRIQVFSLKDPITISCYDEDLYVNDFIGSTTFEVQKLCSKQTQLRWFPVYF
ncbi:MAG: C2 domain-containing protein [bacterium]